MQWALWYSMLDLGNEESVSNTQITENTDRVKSLAAKASLKKRFTQFGLSKIKSKKDFDQLLNFEIFDYETHKNHDDQLLNLFLD